MDEEIPSLQLPDVEALWLIRLLCEAWELNGGTARKKHGNIIVRAPATPDDWFRPFGKKPTNASAKAIGQQMIQSGAKRDVESFLKGIIADKPLTKNEVAELKTTIDGALTELNAT
jgi:hypothetical protein